MAALALALEKWIRGEPGGEAGAQRTAAASGQDSAETGAAVGEAAMDFSRLDEFREFDDEHLSMTREVIGLFVADTPMRLDAIDAAVAAGDVEALSSAAHALKGAAGNVGATAMHVAAGELEHLAKAGWPADAAQRAARLRALWAGTQAALEAWAGPAA